MTNRKSKILRKHVVNGLVGEIIIIAIIIFISFNIRANNYCIAINNHNSDDNDDGGTTIIRQQQNIVGIVSAFVVVPSTSSSSGSSRTSRTNMQQKLKKKNENEFLFNLLLHTSSSLTTFRRKRMQLFDSIFPSSTTNNNNNTSTNTDGSDATTKVQLVTIVSELLGNITEQESTLASIDNSQSIRYWINELESINKYNNNRNNNIHEYAGAENINNINDNDNNNVNNVDNIKRFNPFAGLYDVKYVQQQESNGVANDKKKDNPVGGKWTRPNRIVRKIVRTKRTYQHILPINTTGIGNVFITRSNANTNNSNNTIPVIGEVINVILLEAIGGLISIFVILRGDAIPLTKKERMSKDNYVQPLSSLAIRALFDSPRIVFVRNKKKKTTKHNNTNKSFCNINLGPKSSVTLDTSYIDNRIRIGVGGRSGSRFVFQRCCCSSDVNDSDEPNQFLQYMQQEKPLKRSKVMISLLSIITCSIYSSIKITVTTAKSKLSLSLLLKMIPISISIVGMLLLSLIIFSSGGIEENDNRYSTT